MNDNTSKYQSEELEDISLATSIHSYKKVITFIFCFLFLSFTLGHLISYPEKIVGSSIILSNKQINNIYSPNNGEIELFVKENIFVDKGELIAQIKNPTTYSDLLLLKQKLGIIDLYNLDSTAIHFRFKNDLKLGDIENYYHNFLSSLNEYNNFIKIDINQQKIVNLNSKIVRNNEKLKIGKIAQSILNKKKEIIENSFKVDSSLFRDNIIIKDKVNESKLKSLNSKEKELSLTSSNQELLHMNQELKDDIRLMKKEREKTIKSLFFDLKRTFDELVTAIDFWEHNYTIKAPISGKIEYYKPFLSSTHYVKKDSPLFIILPKADSIYARGIMSAEGYGKIKMSDTVLIKLKDYPHKEYGEIKGTVKNKSKVYHDSIYYMDIELPEGLKTNHKKTIEFTYNMAGQVEYFTKKRSILQRIFSEIQNSIEN